MLDKSPNISPLDSYGAGKLNKHLQLGDPIFRQFEYSNSRGGCCTVRAWWVAQHFTIGSLWCRESKQALAVRQPNLSSIWYLSYDTHTRTFVQTIHSIHSIPFDSNGAKACPKDQASLHLIVSKGRKACQKTKQGCSIIHCFWRYLSIKLKQYDNGDHNSDKPYYHYDNDEEDQEEHTKPKPSKKMMTKSFRWLWELSRVLVALRLY
jgi:hypothetical protein